MIHPHLFGRAAFQVCGYLGLALAIAMTQALAFATGRSPWVMAAVAAAAVAVFFALAGLTKLSTGVERLTHYHHLIAIIAVAALLLRLLGQPVMPYLDLAALGIGIFTACGRVGCTLAGCCHGRPHRWGLRYGPAYARSALSPHLVGLRLFPVQPAESLLATCVTAFGAAIVLTGRPPGTALAWYVLAYSLGRFTLEFLRGDADRRYWRGLSEAQWTAVALSIAVGAAGLAGVLPQPQWYAIAAGAPGVAAVAVALSPAGGVLRRPGRVSQLSAALQRAAVSGDSVIQLASTVGGLTISAGALADTSGVIHHYSLSRVSSPLAEQEAQALGALIADLRHPGATVELRRGNYGIYHVLIRGNALIGDQA